MLSPRSPKACWFCRRTTRGTVGGWSNRHPFDTELPSSNPEWPPSPSGTRAMDPPTPWGELQPAMSSSAPPGSYRYTLSPPAPIAANSPGSSACFRTKNGSAELRLPEGIVYGVSAAIVYPLRFIGPMPGKNSSMNASVGTAGLKRISLRTTGGLRLSAGTAFSPRHDAIGVRAQSSVYFAPDQWRETDFPAIGSGTPPRCPYPMESVRNPAPSDT